ncbi:MAG: exodeoxyribonuclease VII large subunit, partial [Actinobacteria bacterium]|nr:exodeoxyribonuclease VII large subunit [Actinomycetota bacterium]
MDEPIRTWTPGELHEAINGLLEHVFGAVVWVEGEVQDLSRSKAGHVYFRLVDTAVDGDRQDNLPALAVTLFDSRRRDVNRFLTSQGEPLRMSDGVRIRIGGRIATYAARSTLQLLMDRIDPAFTLGLLGQQRARLLAALAAEDLLDRNAATAMPVVPLRVALVTSIGSAAHADVLDELARSDIGFHVEVLDARTQGSEAPDSIVAALRTAAGIGVDVILLVRGGGAATDLVAFDDEGVARTIAAGAVPVITGIGHETDTTVADAVAHTARKTPTAAAAALVDVVRLAQRRILEDWDAIRSGAVAGLDRASDRLTLTGRHAAMASEVGLVRQLDAIEVHRRQIDAGAHRGIRRAGAQLDALSARPGRTARSVLDRAGDRLTI